ncbi:MAG: hypothetical protein EOP84_06690 [Verrucomicrobiaceae bacterium]|nr:MAG: hypothetical protein EOP84_06690 [Verrucomicrobiaceae bacterium]
MKLLETLRSDPTTWKAVSSEARHSEERGDFDGNERLRFQILLTLQHDRLESDAELIRHLFTHEIIAAENDSFQGLGHALTLAAFLLARYRDPSDAPLFARAKLANFDTACGFPLEFMFIVAGRQAENIVRSKSPDLWGRLMSSADLEWTPEGLGLWWNSLNDDYPASAEEEMPLALYERALAFDDSAWALRQLERWASSEPESDSKRRTLMHRFARIGEFDRAATVSASILERCSDPWDRASALSDMVKLYREAGHFSHSLNAARQLDSAFAASDRWIGYGLGRMSIHEVFELSLAHPEASGATAAFHLADRWFQRSRDLAWVGMEAGAKAAKHCSLVDKAMEYEAIAAAERKRIDDELESAFNKGS